MPNHFHGIVWIIEVDDPFVGADGIRPVMDGIRSNSAATDEGARRAPRHDQYDSINGADGIHPITQSANEGARRSSRLTRRPKSLGAFIAGFKSSVTSRACRELIMTAVWQRNYYDHILRNEAEYRRIFDYIQNNPAQWQQDQLHPSAPPNPFNRENENNS